MVEVIDEIDGIGFEFGIWCFNLCKLNIEFVIWLNVEFKGDIFLMEVKIEEFFVLIWVE